VETGAGGEDNTIANVKFFIGYPHAKAWVLPLPMG
jgi:hypothetical protein